MQGLHGLLAAHGLQGLHAFAAQGLQGLHGLHAAVAAQGLHGLHGLPAAFAAQGLKLACNSSEYPARATSSSEPQASGSACIGANMQKLTISSMWTAPTPACCVGIATS